MKALLKVEHCNLPLSIPAAWRDYFDQQAALMGISRNSALCMALKLGAPLLGSHVQAMKKALQGECERINRTVRPGKARLGLPELAGHALKSTR